MAEEDFEGAVNGWRILHAGGGLRGFGQAGRYAECADGVTVRVGVA